MLDMKSVNLIQFNANFHLRMFKTTYIHNLIWIINVYDLEVYPYSRGHTVSFLIPGRERIMERAVNGMSLTFLACLAHQLCAQENFPQNGILISVLHHATLPTHTGNTLRI